MNDQHHDQALWRTFPLISFIVSEWQLWRAEQEKPCYSLAVIAQDTEGLPPYGLDMWPLLELPFTSLDEEGVPYYAKTEDLPGGYYATAIAQYGLAHWNAYLAKGDEKHRESFIIQANWLVSNETRFSEETGGWPFTVPYQTYHAEPLWMSALTQGNGISVLVRAYRLTGKDIYLEVARRVVHTFELDITKGGVSVSLGDNGIFFEEYAVSPASHVLNGYIFSVLGLFDYVELTHDAQIMALIEHSLVTMHSIIDKFDMGFWSRYDLLYKCPASLFYHDQHVTLLLALSRYSGCAHCSMLATRWLRYQRSLRCRICYFIVSRFTRYRSALKRLGMRRTCFRLLGVKEQGV